MVILLPCLKNRGGNWENLVTRSETRGSRLLERREFKTLYSKTLESINIPTIVVTIGCLGEDFTNGLNRKRDEYNTVIRNLASSIVYVADAGKAFDTYLKTVDEPSTYLLPSYYKIYSDSFLHYHMISFLHYRPFITTLPHHKVIKAILLHV